MIKASLCFRTVHSLEGNAAMLIGFMGKVEQRLELE